MLTQITQPSETLERFGKNEFGDVLWRIVWAPSRRTLAIDFDGYSYHVPMYRNIGQRWILERWITGWEFSRCSPAEWAAGPGRTLGPYPSRGTYQHAFTFDEPLSNYNLEKLISWIEASRKCSWQDTLDAVRGEYEAEEKATSETRRAIIYDALPAFGAAASSGFGGGKGTKHLPNLKTANELGLPLGQNKFVQMKGKNAANRKTVPNNR